MNGRSSKAAGVTKFRLKRVESDTNGRMLNARYGVDGLRTKKQDANGNSSREYGVGISTSASTPLTQNSTAPSISYISGPMILGAEINGEFVYHLGDALSTVRDVVDDEGDVIRSFEFDEYGNLLNLSGSGAASPKTWIGGLSVNDDRADSGLWNMGHRNYAGGVLGRFISRDPIGFSGSSLNLYAYPTNPVNFVDPAGLWELIPPSPAEIAKAMEGVRKLGIAAGMATADGPFPAGDAAAVPTAASGAKDLGQAILQYVLRAQMVPPVPPLGPDEDDDDRCRKPHNLHRAVGPNEKNSIETMKHFTPNPSGIEVKYFYQTRFQAVDFANSRYNAHKPHMWRATGFLPANVPHDHIFPAGEGEAITLNNYAKQ